MNTQNRLETAERLLAEWSRGTNYPQPHRLDIGIDSGDLPAVADALVRSNWGYLAAITGMDPGVATGSLWVLYHFAEGEAIVTLRLTVPRDAPAVPTLHKIVPLSEIYERELYEVLGVEIAGMADKSRLFIPDDWPEGVYPMRKDFEMADATPEGQK